MALAIWGGFVLLECLIDPAILPMALVWAANGMMLMMVLRFCLERAPERGLLRALVFVLATIATALLQTLFDLSSVAIVGQVLLAGMGTPPAGYTVSPLSLPPLLGFKISMRSYLWIYGLYAAAVALHGLARVELKAREESYVARLKAQKAELDALRLHVNPHFLFNALNGLASLAGTEKSRDTERMALDLARYYRSSFIDMDQDVLPLSEELEGVEAYLDLETRRLVKLTSILDCPEDLLSTPVPAMILQPLVENAVKYGVAGHENPPPVRIEVRALGGRVSLVCESGVSPHPDAPGTGSGLENVRRRLERAFGDEASLTQEQADNRWRVTIILPREEGLARPEGLFAVASS